MRAAHFINLKNHNLKFIIPKLRFIITGKGLESASHKQP